MKGFPIITATSFDHMKVKLELTDGGRPNGERKVKGRENQSTNSPSSKTGSQEKWTVWIRRGGVSIKLQTQTENADITILEDRV